MNSKDSQLADTRRQLAQQRSEVTRLTREATEQRRQVQLLLIYLLWANSLYRIPVSSLRICRK